MDTSYRIIFSVVILLSAFASASGQVLEEVRDSEVKMVLGVPTTPWKGEITKAVEQNLPKSVDNSLSPHFPPIFSQIGNSCAQASGIGYLFTYEMNSLLNRDASLAENRFSYLYCWNFINGGKDEGGFSSDGLSLSMSSGVMPESDFPRQTMQFQYYWASGFDKYLNALKYRAKSFNRIEIASETDLAQVKSYLYNKGEDGHKGGLLCFSGYSSNWTMDNDYSGPSETGYKCMLTKLATDGAHGMTIVGYDDTVEYTSADGKLTKGAFIAVNSWGDYMHDRGHYYLPYELFLSEHDHLALGNDLLGVEVEYRDHPLIVFRVALDYSSRDDLALWVGVNSKSTSSYPFYDYPSPMFKNCGGDYPMQGQYAPSSIEFAIDFSSYADKVDGLEEPTYFLTVKRGHYGSKYGEGTIKSVAVYDYRENPSRPKIYKPEEDIEGTVLEEGSNCFSIPTVTPPKCSYTPVLWLNALTGQPAAAPLVFRTAKGKYAKVRFSEYDREAGTIKLKYVYAADGSRNLK